MRYFWLFLIFLTLSSCGNSVSHKKKNVQHVYIEDSDYDFGVIEDTVRTLRHKFLLINPTQKVCNIKNIEKSCGCTNVTISKNSIAPSDSAEIAVTVNIGNNYNFFEKDVNIYTDICVEPLTIYIRATRKMPPFVLKQQFPFRISDDLRLNTNCALLGYVQHGEIKSVSLNVTNLSDKEVSLKCNSQLPSYLSIDLPDHVAEHEISRIVVSCDLTGEKFYGERDFSCELEDSYGNTFALRIYMIVTEKMSKSKKAPRIMCPITAYNLKNSRDSFFFPVINCGKSVLSVRDVSCKPAHIRYNLSKPEINVGDTAYLKVWCADGGLGNSKEVVVGMITNDPIEPFKQLKLIY